MILSTREKLKLLLNRRGMTMGDLADRTGQTRQNLSNKMSRDNFSENDLRAMADALNCECDIKFRMRDTGEEI